MKRKWRDYQDLADINLGQSIHGPASSVVSSIFSGNRSPGAVQIGPRIPEFSQSKASLASVSGFVAKNKGALSDKISALPGLGSLAMNVKEGFKYFYWL